MRLAKSATDWPSLPMTEENEENHGKPVFDPIRWSLARMLKMNTKCQWQYGCMHDPSRNLTPYKATILWSPKGTISWSLMGLGCCIMQWSPPGVPGREIGSKLWFFSDDDVIECDHWGWAGHSVDQAWLGRYLQCMFIHFKYIPVNWRDEGEAWRCMSYQFPFWDCPGFIVSFYLLIQKQSPQTRQWAADELWIPSNWSPWW